MDQPYIPGFSDDSGYDFVFAYEQGNHVGDFSNSESPESNGHNDSPAALVGTTNQAYVPVVFEEGYEQYNAFFPVPKAYGDNAFPPAIGFNNGNVNSMQPTNCSMPQQASYNLSTYGYGNQQMNPLGINPPTWNNIQASGTYANDNSIQYSGTSIAAQYTGPVAQGGQEYHNASYEAFENTPPADELRRGVRPMSALERCFVDDPSETSNGSHLSPKTLNTKSPTVKHMGKNSGEEVKNDGDGDYVDEQGDSPHMVNIKRNRKRKNDPSGPSGSPKTALEAEVDRIGQSGNTEAHYLRVKKLMRKESNGRYRDNSFPEDPQQQRSHVLRLVQAFFSIDGVNDKRSVKGDLAQAVVRFKNQYYSPMEVKMVCWELLFKCRDAQSGIRLVPQYHKSKVEDSQTFTTRWDALVNACENNKALCKQIMDPSYKDRVVEAPLFEAKMKDSNRKINAERDKQNSVGRTVIKSGIDINLIHTIGSTQEESPPGTSTGPNETLKWQTPTNKEFNTPEGSETFVPPQSSTGKRKYSSLQPSSLDQGDDFEYEETPSKKNGSTSKSNRKFRSSAATAAATASSDPFAASTILDAASNGPEHITSPLQVQENGAYEANGAAAAIEKLPNGNNRGAGENSRTETNHEKEYKKIIRDMFDLSHERYSSATLQQLRSLAHPYNIETREDLRAHPGGNQIVSVSIFTRTVRAFALSARGAADVFDLRGTNGRQTLVAPGRLFFNTYGNKNLNDALGVISDTSGSLGKKST